MKHDPLRTRPPIDEAISYIRGRYDTVTARIDRDRPRQNYRHIPYDDGGVLPEGPWYPRYDSA